MPITRAARANRTLLLNKIKFAFGSVVSEFLFPICVQKASSMKILLFCVINSSYLARSGFDTNNSWIKPRTPHFLWRKLYLLLFCTFFSSVTLHCINFVSVFPHPLLTFLMVRSSASMVQASKPCQLLLQHTSDNFVTNRPLSLYCNYNLVPRLRGIKQKKSHRG